MTTTMILNDEIDHMMTLCTHISQMASRIRLQYIGKSSFPPEYLKYCQQELLSMLENVEGSTILLETLLIVEQCKPKRKIRYGYTREELLNKRQYVTVELSMTTRQLLINVIEHESQFLMNYKNRSWRDIRTILA